jgi:hypothetical protein
MEALSTSDRRSVSTELRGTTSQKTAITILVCVKTGNLKDVHLFSGLFVCFPFSSISPEIFSMGYKNSL